MRNCPGRFGNTSNCRVGLAQSQRWREFAPTTGDRPRRPRLSDSGELHAQDGRLLGFREVRSLFISISYSAAIPCCAVDPAR
jgi:hypothetical protein